MLDGPTPLSSLFQVALKRRALSAGSRLPLASRRRAASGNVEMSNGADEGKRLSSISSQNSINSLTWSLLCLSSS